MRRSKEVVLGMKKIVRRNDRESLPINIVNTQISSIFDLFYLSKKFLFLTSFFLYSFFSSLPLPPAARRKAHCSWRDAHTPGQKILIKQISKKVSR
jgi:hypothetical protein